MIDNRVFTNQLGNWPVVVATDDGGYAVGGRYDGPHIVVEWIMVAVACFLMFLCVWWMFKQLPLGGYFTGLLALVAAYYLAKLPGDRLFIMIGPDGEFKNKGVVFNFLTDSYRLHPQAHSGAEKEARDNERLLHQRQQAWAVKAHEAQQKKEPPPPQPGPPMAFYAGSSELFVIRGGGQWIQIVEFGDDPQARKAVQLAAALEFIFHQIKLQQARLSIQIRQSPPLQIEGQQSLPEQIAAPRHEADEYE